MAGLLGRGVGAAGLTAALVVGLLMGCTAHADDSRKQERRIGEAAAEREMYVGQLVLFDAKQIALGELALQRSQDPRVRQYAKQLVADHRKHLNDLRTWADTQSLELAAVDLSGPAEEEQQGTGGSGNAGIQEGYDERMEGMDRRLDEAIGDAQKDLNEVRAKEGTEFDKAFVSRVVEDQEKGQDLVGNGLDTYRADAAFSLLLNRTGNLIDRHVERGKNVEKALD
jgi:predicted outer membrane protein